VRHSCSRGKVDSAIISQFCMASLNRYSKTSGNSDFLRRLIVAKDISVRGTARLFRQLDSFGGRVLPATKLVMDKGIDCQPSCMKEEIRYEIWMACTATSMESLCNRESQAFASRERAR
jgi:hypothetical protein